MSTYNAVARTCSTFTVRLLLDKRRRSFYVSSSLCLTLDIAQLPSLAHIKPVFRFNNEQSNRRRQGGRSQRWGMLKQAVANSHTRAVSEHHCEQEFTGFLSSAPVN